MRIHAATVAALLAVAGVAQSPLTTLYAWNNGGAAGWTMYFDLQVNIAVSITQIDTNNGGAQVAGSLDVHYKTGTFVGFDTNPSAWTLGSSGPCTGAALNTPTTCALATPFVLVPGNYGIAIVHNGIAPYYTNGTGTATPGSGTNQTWSNAELTLLAGASASGGLGTALCCNPRVFNGSIHYAPGAGYATKTLYGDGCYNRFRSFYELFNTAPAFDLGNSSLSMIPTGTGYLVLPGISTYVTPPGSATTIANGNDVEQTVALASPFTHAAGVTSALTVCSNGMVSTAAGNGIGSVPSAAGFLGFGQTCWCTWHDFNPPGGGAIKFHESSTVSYVTWQAVADGVGAGVSTFQYQFDRGSGLVHVIWQGMSTLGGSFLTGFKPGGTVADPGNRDISATLAASFTLSPDQLALALDASARPVLGTTSNLVTTRFPAGSLLGANILSFTSHSPGIDLGSLGLPGCRQFVGLDSVVAIVPAAGSASRPMTLPANTAYANMHLFSQSAAFVPGANPAGVIASNGLDLGVNIQ